MPWGFLHDISFWVSLWVDFTPLSWFSDGEHQKPFTLLNVPLFFIQIAESCKMLLVRFCWAVLSGS